MPRIPPRITPNKMDQNASTGVNQAELATTNFRSPPLYSLMIKGRSIVANDTPTAPRQSRTETRPYPERARTSPTPRSEIVILLGIRLVAVSLQEATNKPAVIGIDQTACSAPNKVD